MKQDNITENIAIKRLNDNNDKRDKMIDLILDKYTHLPDAKFYAKEKQLQQKSFVQLLKLSGL